MRLALFRSGVSFRDVEEMAAANGVVVSYETCWCDKFGEAYAVGIRRRRARTGDKWHLDEVFLKINGITHYLRRAVDQKGVVLDFLEQPRRDRFAAIRFFRRVVGATGRRSSAPDHLFGSWEMNWMGYNFAHDVALPGSKGKPVPFFMYPQAETGSGRLDCLDADGFRYEITAREI
jgi:hypothetical protein